MYGSFVNAEDRRASYSPGSNFRSCNEEAAVTKLHIPSAIDTSNPVGEVVVKRHARDRPDLVSALVAQIRRLVGRRRTHAAKS
jgi:hypothetical protein